MADSDVCARWRRGGFVLLAFVALAACELPPEERIEERIPPWGVYSEFLELSEVEAQLSQLAGHDASLTLAVSAESIGDQELAALLRQAETSGVDVRLWLVLDTSQGYWPNESNLELFSTEVTRLLDWIEEDNLQASSIVFDMEPAYDYALEIRELNPLDTDGITSLFASHLDEDAFIEARDLLTNTVEEVQARGLRAVCVTFPQVLDDLLDGDHDLQDALDIPIDGVPFDEVGIMVYQTTFAETLGGWCGPSLVTSFAADAVERYGERAVIALGTVSTVGIFGHEFGYDDPSLLATDIAAARAEGIGRVEIFSLDGMVETEGVTAWLAAEPNTEAPDDPAATSIVRTFVQGLDRRLDDL